MRFNAFSSNNAQKNNVHYFTLSATWVRLVKHHWYFRNTPTFFQYMESHFSSLNPGQKLYGRIKLYQHFKTHPDLADGLMACQATRQAGSSSSIGSDCVELKDEKNEIYLLDSGCCVQKQSLLDRY